MRAFWAPTFGDLNDRGLAVKGRRILVLGLAYKKNTGDARESPAIPICRTLEALGAEVRVADPHVPEHQFPECVTPVELTEAEVAAADAVSPTRAPRSYPSRSATRIAGGT